MHKRLSSIFCTLSCALLLLPQGWCCWIVTLDCNKCRVLKKQKEVCSSCCKTKSTENQSSGPLPAQRPDCCWKCWSDTLKPGQLTHDDGWHALAYTLPVWEGAAQPCARHQAGFPADLAGPPLIHVRLCVWRC